MATDIKQISALTDAPADADTALINATAKAAPQAIIMEESACSSYLQPAIERTAATAVGAGLGAGMSYLVCGAPSAIIVAINAGLCLLGGKKTVSFCIESCDDKRPLI